MTSAFAAIGHDTPTATTTTRGTRRTTSASYPGRLRGRMTDCADVVPSRRARTGRSRPRTSRRPAPGRSPSSEAAPRWMPRCTPRSRSRSSTRTCAVSGATCSRWCSAPTGEMLAINSSGRSPAAADPDAVGRARGDADPRAGADHGSRRGRGLAGDPRDRRRPALAGRLRPGDRVRVGRHGGQRLARRDPHRSRGALRVRSRPLLHLLRGRRAGAARRRRDPARARADLDRARAGGTRRPVRRRDRQGATSRGSRAWARPWCSRTSPRTTRRRSRRCGRGSATCTSASSRRTPRGSCCSRSSR